MAGVILFRGISQYQNFNTMTDELAAAFEAAGTRAHVIDARDETCTAGARALVDGGGIRAVITMTGFGLDIRAGGNAYTGMTAPVISLYFDPLFYYLEQLPLPIRPRIVTSSSDTDVGYWQEQADRPADIRHLPHAAAPQAAEAGPPDWDRRTVPLLLSGTGCNDPEDIRTGWDNHGARTRDHLNRILEVYLAVPAPRPLTAIISEAIGAEADLSRRWVLRRYYLWFDLYLRARLRWRLVMALARHPLLVVGERWEKLGERLRERGPTAVRFRRQLDTGSVYDLTGRVRISLNDSTPHHGSHERVFRSLATGALVLTNRTRWFAQHAPNGALVQIDLERDDIAGVVDRLLADPIGSAAIARTGTDWFAAHHTWRQRVETLESWL